MRPETIKILEENTGSNFFNTGRSNIFLDMSPETRDIKAKINYWDYMKLKSFCTAKETLSKTERQPMKWDKVSANDIHNKALISKLYEELKKLNTQKTKNPIRKGQKMPGWLSRLSI